MVRSNIPWPPQIKNIANPVTNNPRIHTRRGIIMSKIRIPNRHLLIIRGKAANKNRSIAASHTIQCRASGLERFIRDFDDFPLLGIHPHGFNGGDVEESGIEVLEVAIEEIAAEDVEATWTLEIGVVVGVYVEAVCWDLGGLDAAFGLEEVP